MIFFYFLLDVIEIRYYYVIWISNNKFRVVSLATYKMIISVSDDLRNGSRTKFIELLKY